LKLGVMQSVSSNKCLNQFAQLHRRGLGVFKLTHDNIYGKQL